MSRADRGIVPPEDAREYMRGLMQRDVDLSPIIDSLRHGTYVPGISEEQMLSDEYIGGTPIWTLLKAERNALTSLAIEDIWRSFALTRSIVVRKLEGEQHPAHALRDVAATLFKQATSGWYRQRIQHLSDLTNETRRFSRMQSIINHGLTVGYVTPDEDLRGYLGRGVNTASKAIWGLIDIVPRLAQTHHLPLTKQQAVRTIEKAYGSVIQMFSSLNQRIGMHFLDPMTDGPHGLFDAQFFSLKPDGADFTLSLRYDRLFAIQNRYFDDVTIQQLQPYGETTWCPARYANGEQKDVVREYFDWSMDMAKGSFIGLLTLPE